MEKRTSVKKNYIYNLIYDILVLFVPLITTPYIARVLSVESIGLYSYTHSIILYFTAFVALGTKSYAIKRIAQAQDKKSASVVLWNAFFLRAIAGALALTVYYIFVFINGENIAIRFIQSFYIIACVFDISWFFQGKENFKIIIFRNLLVKGLTLIIVFVFVNDNSDLLIYAFSLSCLTLIGNLSLWGYLPKYTAKVKLSELNPFLGIKEILVLFIPTLALQIYAAVDKTMLGLLTGSMTENGYYLQADKIIKIGLTAITTLGIVTLPRISALFAKKDFNKVKSSMLLSYRFVFFLSIPMMLGICSVSDLLVPWFLGEKYAVCILLLCVLSVLFIIMGLSNITGFQYLVATDRQNFYSFSISAGTVINIILNLILIPKYKSLGASIATVLAEAAVLIIQIGFVTVVKKEFSVLEICLPSWRYLLSGILMLGVVTAIKSSLPAGFLGLCIAVGIGLVVYLLAVIIMRDKMVIDFLKSYINRFITKKGAKL